MKNNEIMQGVRKRGEIYHLDKTVNGVKIRESLKTSDPNEAKKIASRIIQKEQKIAAVRKNLIDARNADEKWRHFILNQSQTHNSWVKAAFYRMKNSKHGCSMSYEDFIGVAASCNGKCQLTGIRFRYDHIGQKRSQAPYSPSIDRIDSSKGYHLDNVRIVCLVVNIALGAWGEEVLRKIGRAFLLKELQEEIDP